MVKFLRGETVICSVEVKNSSGAYVDPSTSMKITITDYQNGIEVNDQVMTKDSTGRYHYDWNTTTTAAKGVYTAIFTATDGARITKAKDVFTLE